MMPHRVRPIRVGRTATPADSALAHSAPRPRGEEIGSRPRPWLVVKPPVRAVRLERLVYSGTFYEDQICLPAPRGSNTRFLVSFYAAVRRTTETHRLPPCTSVQLCMSTDRGRVSLAWIRRLGAGASEICTVSTTKFYFMCIL